MANSKPKKQNNPPKNPDKLPPQNIEAEQSLLGCLMIDKETIAKVSDLVKPKDFYKHTHQQIYEAMSNLFEKREPIDILSVSTRLKEKNQLKGIGGRSYLTSLINSVPTATHALNYAKIVRQKKVLRELLAASQEIGSLAFQEEEDVDALLDKAEKRIFTIGQRSLTQNFSAVKDELENTFERIDRLSKNKTGIRGLPTGFQGLDNILAGLQKSDLVILASRPSMGKSSLSMDFARHVAIKEKEPVAIFSLEMSTDQIIDRLISTQANIDLWRLRTGRLSDKGESNDFERIQQSLGVLSEAPIYIDDFASSTILQMRAMARRLQAEKGLSLIIVDYLQLMEPADPSLSAVQQVSQNSRALKSLAKELNVPVLVLSQLSRAVEQRTPQIPRLSDLRESGCLTRDTLITRADTGERIPIKKLVGKKDIPVYSLDQNWKLKKKNISKVFSSGRKMTYEMTLRSGRKIKASANHPFRKIDGWSRLDELKNGDSIAVPKKIKPTTPKNELNKEEIILLAHLLGDGCILPHQPYHYTSADNNNIDIVSKAANKLFNIKPKIVKQKNWWHVYLPSPYHLTHDKHHPITNWYKKLGIKRVRSFKKEIPQNVFSLNKDKTSLFLKHLWATDGNISKRNLKNRKPSAAIYYGTTSRKMAEGVSHLLLRFGIRSKILSKKKKDYRQCYNVLIQGKEHQLKFLRNIGSFGKRGQIISTLVNSLEKINPNTNLDVWPKEVWKSIINPVRKSQKISWREFSAGIDTQYCGSSLFKSGIGTKRLTKIATFLESDKIRKVANAEVYWDEIVSIKPLKVEQVYDATIPETHNFIANDIIVHNSIEQDADVVMFIYREDKYRRDSNRKNIADIIIGKHRNGPLGKVNLYFDEQTVSFKTLEKNE